MISVSKLSLIGLLFGNICVINSESSQWAPSPPPANWWSSPPVWGWSPSPPPQWTVPPTPQWSQWSWQPSQTTVDQVSTNQYQSGGSSQLDVFQQNSYPPGQWEYHNKSISNFNRFYYSNFLKRAY